MKTPAAKRNHPWLAITAALALLATGCAMEVGHFTLLKQGYSPKANDFQVEVFTNGSPTRAFERVAILDAHCESQGFLTPNLTEDALPMLIKQARAAGCDAIIEVQEVKMAENWTLETRVKQFTAIGIVFK